MFDFDNYSSDIVNDDRYSCLTSHNSTHQQLRKFSFFLHNAMHA